MNFPCIFPVKVMGANQDDFESLVLSIIQKHASIATEIKVTKRLSGGGKFVSLTVRINAENQAQLDAIYGELKCQQARADTCCKPVMGRRASGVSFSRSRRMLFDARCRALRVASRA